MTLEQLYNIRCQQPSTINQHLSTLYKYAARCEYVAELGVQAGLSTTAFLMAQPAMLDSYDIVLDLRLTELMGLGECRYAYQFDAKYMFDRTVWTFHLADSVKTTLNPTDLLFIDSAHTYLHLKEELHLHNAQVSKWIILHDTETFGEKSENWNDIKNPSKEQVQGLDYAIKEFLAAHNEWQIKEVFRNNNGLTVLERR